MKLVHYPLMTRINQIKKKQSQVCCSICTAKTLQGRPFFCKNTVTLYKPSQYSTIFQWIVFGEAGIDFQHVPKHVEVGQKQEPGLNQWLRRMEENVMAHQPKQYLVTLTAVLVSVCWIWLVFVMDAFKGFFLIFFETGLWKELNYLFLG